MKPFPNKFLWGVSTSSYQIEGAIHSGGRGESIWDRFSSLPGRIADGSSGEMACDHYHNWEEDLDLIQEMGAGAYRFSTAWPRIQPLGSGRFNAEGLQFYSRLVDGYFPEGSNPGYASTIGISHSRCRKREDGQTGTPRCVLSNTAGKFWRNSETG